MKKLRFLLAWALASGLITTAHSQALAGEETRSRIALTKWQFTEDDAKTTDSASLKPPATPKWQDVTVPHIFRQSGLPDNTSGWYRQSFRVEKSDKGRCFYLMLEGAASVKDVFVNGQHAGRHKGAYSRAWFDMTPALKFGGENTLDVRVSNRDSETLACFSRSNLYYVNGGIFRPAWLIKTGAAHLYPDMGSTGLYLTPQNIGSDSADLEIRAVVKNTLPKPANTQVRFVTTDSNGTKCGESTQELNIPAGGTLNFESTQKIANPRIWELSRPNLYTVRAVVSVDGSPVDEITERTGFRSLVFKDKRFYLNGRETQFRGVNKHAQTEYEWNAVSDETLRREWKMMADMGANAVRLAHYPHCELEYSIADEKGIAVWAENGFAGQCWKGAPPEEKAVSADGERLSREMVRQNWNHPSIFFWSAGNETIADTVAHYTDIIRQEKDPSRLITYAANGPEPQNCDFVTHNTYDGWYGNHYYEFTKLPRNAMVSETGCGDWFTHHVPYGTIQWSVDKFEPEEYAGMFTEFRMQMICRKDVANRPMFFWWNFREFYDHKFKNNRNTKGLITLAGEPKDLYFLFQAFLNPGKPVVRLCWRNHFLRAFAADNGIKAYSNAAELRLTVNGADWGTIKNGVYRLPDTEHKDKKGVATKITGIHVANVFFWQKPLAPGRNVIEASDERGNKDRMVIYQMQPGTPLPPDPKALLQDLESSNAQSPAYFIDRPVEAQGAFYTDVDGASDNTFDLLPKEIEGASWIATRRQSDEKLSTGLTFRVNPDSGGAKIILLFSTGKYPAVTLKPSDPKIVTAADAMRKNLKAREFKQSDTGAVWRDHDLNRAEAELWSRAFKAGEKVEIPAQCLDFVVMAAPAQR